MTLADGTTPRPLFLLPISQDQASEWNELFRGLITSLEKLVAHIVHAERYDLLEKLGLDKMDLTALRKRGIQTYYNYARIDTILTKNGPKVLEVNARRPQMFEDADWFNLLIDSTLDPSKLSFLTNSDEIVGAIASCYVKNKGYKPQEILLITNNRKEQISFSFVSALKREFKDSNIRIISVKEFAETQEQFRFSENLTYKNLSVDLIINQNLAAGLGRFYKRGAIINSAIRDAYNQNLVEIASPPSSLAFGSKISLALLLDEQIQTQIGLDTHELESLKLLPKSLTVKEFLDKSFKSGEPSLGFDHKDWVIKSSKSISGNGVRLGSSFSSVKEFMYFLNEVNEAGLPSIVQEYVERVELDYINLETGSAERGFATLEPFLVNAGAQGSPIVSGYSTRSINAADAAGISKFNPADDIKEINFGSVAVYQD